MAAARNHDAAFWIAFLFDSSLSRVSGTTLNGKVAYFSVVLRSGYQVQTSGAASTITTDDAELDMSPNTIALLVRGT